MAHLKVLKKKPRTRKPNLNSIRAEINETVIKRAI